MIGVCGTCARPAEATAENEGYSYCCNDRIEYGDEAAATVARANCEHDYTTTEESDDFLVDECSKCGDAVSRPKVRLSDGWSLTEVPPPARLVIKVHPETVPTTTAPYHARATHVDALGMPVAYSQAHPDDPAWPYHPTPCCGAAASISDGPMYCKACYAEVDPAFGNHPVEPYRPIQEVTNVTTTDNPLTTMQAVQKVLARAKKPMTAKEIAAKVVPMVPGLKGKTPEATVAAKLYVEAKKPDGIVKRAETAKGFVLRRA